MSTPYGVDPLRPETEPLPTVAPVEAPLTVIPVEPPPRPPHPGFWMSVVWSVVFVLVLNGAAVLAFVPIMMVQAARSGNFEAYLNRLIVQKPDQKAELTAEAARLLAPAVVIGQVVTVSFAFLIVRLIVGRGWRRELAVRMPGPLHLFLLLLGLPAFLILPEALHGLAKQVLPSFDYQKELTETVRHWHWVYGVLGIGLGAGIGEELWCRGFLGRGLLARCGVGGGIVLTSLLFGLMHLDPPHVVATAFMGAALHFLYVMTRSLIAPMLVHTLNNSAGFLQIMVGEDYPQAGAYLNNLDALPLPDKIPLFLSCAVLLAAVGWALYRSRVTIAAEEGGVPAWQPPFPGVADPPAGSGLILARGRLPAYVLGAVLAAVLIFVQAFWRTAEHAQQKAAKPVPLTAVGGVGFSLPERDR